jgi:hypothetical protein
MTRRALRNGWVRARSFPTRIKARPLGAQPVAARADSSCLRPVVVSARAGLAADGGVNLGRKRQCPRQATLREAPTGRLRLVGRWRVRCGPRAKVSSRGGVWPAFVGSSVSCSALTDC